MRGIVPVGLLLGAVLAACSSVKRSETSTEGTGTDGGVPVAREAGPSPRPPVTPVGDAGGDASSSDEACGACGRDACGAAFAECADAGPACSGCFAGDFTSSCFSRSDVSAAVACVCGAACGARACKDQCATYECLRCISGACARELDACQADPACRACQGSSPPPSCATNTLATTLYACTCQHCRSTACGAFCP